MRPSRLLYVLPVASLAGCSTGPPEIMPKAPHGGAIVALPGNPNSIEVLRQESPDHPGKARLLVYGLDADLKPLTPAPTSATLKPRGRRVKSLELRPTNDSDPSRAGELATEPFEDPGEVSGELTITIGGKPASVEIGVR